MSTGTDDMMVPSLGPGAARADEFVRAVRAVRPLVAGPQVADAHPAIHHTVLQSNADLLFHTSIC
jgi:hypothetical protein